MTERRRRDENHEDHEAVNQLDQDLRAALGGATVPETLWPGLLARMAEADRVAVAEAAGSGRRARWSLGGEAVPALTAVASFCILFEFYLSGGASLVSGPVGGFVDRAVLWAQNFLVIASSLAAGR